MAATVAHKRCRFNGSNHCRGAKLTVSMLAVLQNIQWLLVIPLAAIAPAMASGMQIEWTRMAGQWPVEASPVVLKSSESANEQILVLNRGGQVLLWKGDGT